MKASLPTLIIALICCSLCILAGCEPGNSLVQAKGSITIDGNPVGGAVLLFHPTSGQGSVSSAESKADGTFVPVTNTEPGIPVGSYKVTVTWPAPPAKPKNDAIALSSEALEPGPDQLKGRYLMKDKSQISVEIGSSTTEIPAIAVTTK
jgi:hypothetical protein